MMIMTMLTTGDTDTSHPDASAPDTMTAGTTDEVNPTDARGPPIMTTTVRSTTAMAFDIAMNLIAAERNARTRGAGRPIAKFASLSNIPGMSGSLQEMGVLPLGIAGGGLLLNSQ